MKLGANRYGTYYAKIKDNKITNIEPFSPNQGLFELNLAMQDVLHHSSRVKHPYVRKSFLADPANPKPELRGKEEFVQVSWDVALDLTAHSLKQAYEKHGASAVYGESYFWGANGRVSNGRRCVRRMLDLMGGFVSESGDYSLGAGIVVFERFLGRDVYFPVTDNWQAVLKNAKNVVFWGANPLVTSEISSRIPLHNGYAYFEKLKQSDIKIYSIDVFKNESAKFFNAKTLLLRPSTDTAMMIGMCHYLYTNNLHDKEFLTNNCVGFDKFKEYFMGEKDGVVKDIAWASEICGIAKDEIESFTLELAKNPTKIICGRSIQRSDHGEQAYWAIITLSAMLGGFGKAGEGLDIAIGFGGCGDVVYKAPNMKNFCESPKNSKLHIIPSSRMIEAFEGKTQTLEQNGEVINMPNVKVMISASGN
ncbi:MULTISPECIES: molybdopterin-dependent oxidoreductase, partial [unclassified Campylobacter]|uniref:molybdopterin-dependent oxidoreductase n=1 Tax=unclassified Campylobacter TaxID=2593542 RepID=UPI003D325AE0